MQKSTRPAPAQGGLNPDRRYSQPVLPSGSDQQRKGPRYSDVAPPGPGTGGMPGQLDDKLSGDKGGGPPPMRKITRVKDGPEADPDNYNPDGSLRMVHRMPKQQDAFEQANKARYLRRRSPVEWEKSLTVQQIFEK